MSSPLSIVSARPNLFVVAAIFLACVISSLTGYVVYEMRLDALLRARELGSNVTLVLERDIVRNLELYELSMRAVIDGVKQPEVMSLPPSIRQLVLFDRASTASDLGAILVSDSSGKVTVDSQSYPPRPMGVADRDYFLAQQQQDVGLFISKPFFPHGDRAAASIALSRRLSGADGVFNGIVVGTLRLNYFSRLFDGVDVGQHGSIAILLTDGTGLMRWPYSEKFIGVSLSNSDLFRRKTDAMSGAYASKASVDGVERYYNFRRIGNYPLVVVVGMATDEIYASWRERAWNIGAVVVALNGVLIWLSLLVARHLRLRREAEEQLQLLANTDGLTGLGSRRALDDALALEWRRSNRNGQSLAILMIDVDDFKKYNDLYGHTSGDHVLRAVARCIANRIRRPGDFAGRYGGEEFCAVLPNTSLAGAIRVADDIRSEVLALDEAHGDSAHRRVTVSIGVAVHDPATASDEEIAVCLSLADRQLYEAKNAGKNLTFPRSQRLATLEYPVVE